MTLGGKIALSMGGTFLAVVAILIVSYISAFNAGNRAEKQIAATYENNQNVLSTYYQKVQEVVQVPDMMKDDLKDVISSALTARYGEDGIKSAFAWITENYPGQVDAALYTKIQQVIEAGREDFKVSQTQLIDQKRAYETQLGSFWRGTWLTVAGYPKIDLAQFKVITTEQAEKAFAAGKEAGPLKLR
jgi:hypothetical protein